MLQQTLVHHEGDPVDGEGSGRHCEGSSEEDRQTVSPVALPEAVRHVPVGPPVRPVRLQPGLDHVEREDGEPAEHPRQASSLR